MEIIGIHPDILGAQPQPVDGLGHGVGEGQRAIAGRPHRGAIFTFAPASAIAGVHRNRIRLRVGAKMANRMLHHQGAQTGLADTELGIAPRPALPPHQGQIFGMLLEGLPIRPHDRLVGVSAVQLESLRHPVPLAPLAIGGVIVAPQPPIIPDPAGMKGRLFQDIDRHLQAFNPGHHLPGGAREKLAISQPVQEIPDRVFHRQVGGPQHP